MTQYFDRHGRQLTADEALDEHGLIRSGVILRTSMQARDSRTPLTDMQCTLGAAGVRDGLGGLDGLHRPGSRVDYNINQDMLDEVERARREHDEHLANAWRGNDTVTAFRSSDARRIEPDPDEDDDDEPPRRRRRWQGRDPQGRESGTWESDGAPTLDELRLEHDAAVEAAYSTYDAELVAASKRDRG